MAEARINTLSAKWNDLAPSFLRARQALFAAKDHDNIYTAFLSSHKPEEAANKVAAYSERMMDAKRDFAIIRVTFNDIDPEDMHSPVVKEILDKWNDYFKLYKQLCMNFSKAQTFRRNRSKIEEKEKLRMEEVKNAQEVRIKKLELESLSASINLESSTPGTSTSNSRASPSPASLRNYDQFKPKITLSSEITFLEMMDWKVETLAWFKAANHSNIDPVSPKTAAPASGGGQVMGPW